ncbi:MAG: 4-hydroxythreonine-4-phosphate dehydrogenase PdxA, partial [Pseudomonadota bacterium]
MTESSTERLPLAVSMGEPAGIGTEILLRTWKHFAEMPPEQGPTFFLIDDPVRVERISRELNADIPVATLSDPARASDLFPDALPVMSLKGEELKGLSDVAMGKPTPATAAAVTASIDRAVKAVGASTAGGIVTLPIQKEVLVDAGFAHPGHTEYLEKLTADMPLPKGVERGAVMILTAGPFRVVPVTLHVPLAKVPELVTVER